MRRWSSSAVRRGLAFTRRAEGAIAACIRRSALCVVHGANIMRSTSVCTATQVSAKAICFSTTILVISACDAAVGLSMPHQIIGILRAMISAEDSPISKAECFM